jgi:hypothetical protein
MTGGVHHWFKRKSTRGKETVIRDDNYDDRCSDSKVTGYRVDDRGSISDRDRNFSLGHHRV